MATMTKLLDGLKQRREDAQVKARQDYASLVLRLVKGGRRARVLARGGVGLRKHGSSRRRPVPARAPSRREAAAVTFRSWALERRENAKRQLSEAHARARVFGECDGKGECTGPVSREIGGRRYCSDCGRPLAMARRS